MSDDRDTHSHGTHGSDSDGHTHSHASGGAHPHDPEPVADGPHLARAPLDRDAGAGGLLFLDCFSGVAGDMTIAALVDLGVPFDVIRKATDALPIGGYEISMSSRTRSGIVAAKFDVDVTEPQPHRTYGEIDDMLQSSTVDERVRALARKIFRRLGEAEAHTHRMPLRDVHFHEVGAVDAIVDIVGASAAIVYVGADVVVSPLPMGRGFVRAQHGVLPLPAPATLTCLAGAPTVSVNLEHELVTPTGAAIVASVASAYARWPTMRPQRVGYGSGTRTLPDRPNLLRAVLGERVSTEVESDTHVVIEANMDDITGELAGHAIDALLLAGALDVWAAPITMKKGRPALCVSAIAPARKADDVAAAFLRETTTIGVRHRAVSRTERPRRIVEVPTKYGVIPVKVSGGDYGPVQAKPEVADCARASREHRVPLREVIDEALCAWRNRA